MLQYCQDIHIFLDNYPEPSPVLLRPADSLIAIMGDSGVLPL